MITIDITQRAAARAYDFHPGYGRRTDADRRPARPVVRPNDGPGPNREQVSREIMDRLIRPKPWMADETASNSPKFDQSPERAIARMRAYLTAVLNGALTNAEVATIVGEDSNVIRFIGDRAVKRGYLNREPMQMLGRLRIAPLSITDAGRAWLEANR